MDIPIRPSKPKQPMLQSSLDMVWSFSRSTAFIGSQLPSSPSFVAHYQRPASGFTDQSDTGSLAPTVSEGESDEEDESEGESDDYPLDGVDDRLSGADWPDVNAQALPPNATAKLLAKAKARGRRRSSRRRRSSPQRMAPFSFSALQSQQAPSENTPLLAPAGIQYDYSSSPDVPSPFLRAPPPHQHKQSAVEASLKDISNTASAESALVDDNLSKHGGSSTFAQTLFNSVNVLVGIGILAERAFYTVQEVR